MLYNNTSRSKIAQAFPIEELNARDELDEQCSELVEGLNLVQLEEGKILEQFELGHT